MKKRSLKIAYGNHWNFGLNVGDTFILIKKALEICGILADIEKEPSPNHVNIVMENFDEKYLAKMQAIHQQGGRFIIIGTEFLTGSTFNNFKFEEDTSYYFDRDYWANRYRCFLMATEFAQAVWHFSDIAVDDFSAQFALPVLYFPHHYVPGFKQVQHRSDEEKDIDFLFTGAKTDYRLDLLKQLSGKGYKVEVVHALTAPFHRNDLIARSKIALNLKQFQQWPYPSQSRFFYHIINDSLMITEPTEVIADIQEYVLTGTGDFIQYCESELAKGHFNARAQANRTRFAAERPMKNSIETILTASGLC
ncbi:hypothetical protein DN730_11390 [Marinomonas piezotolerans]|uniref:Glycosyltransferase family 1 protein n=1 Tax=Marinomonas piezotolerans TaxID=2213058 RepID=A0A370U8X7_9GAMM|nr:hypothetical protein [Marinomonas piezotolerans]RDL44224.1 hypothetical protein DN730_11390 [Marinomonas piezotolerans]